MNEDEKPIKQKTERVGQVEQSTLYATDLEALKYAIEEVRDSSYWNGFNAHKAQSSGQEKFILEKRVKELEAKIEAQKDGAEFIKSQIQNQKSILQQKNRTLQGQLTRIRNKFALLTGQ